MAAHQAPPSLGFSKQKHWSGLPFPSPMHESEKWKWSRSVVSDSYDPMDCSLPGSSVHGIFQARVLEWGAIALRLIHVLYSRNQHNIVKQFVVQSLSCLQLFVNPWPHQASLSFTISWNLLRLISIESVMPANHLILCRPLFLPSILPSIRVFSKRVGSSYQVAKVLEL